MDVSKVDIEFSRYIRRKEADDFGMVRCYTCGKRLPWSVAECGHYIPRAHMATRFLQTNCHPQCFTCNHELRGNIAEYRARLIEDYGEDKVNWLEGLKMEQKRYLPVDLEDLYKLYKRLNKSLTI